MRYLTKSLVSAPATFLTLVSSLFLSFLAFGQVSKDCGCSNLKDLQKELELAVWLQAKFANEIDVLKAKNKADANQAYFDFVKAVKADPKLPPDPSGIGAIEFETRNIYIDSLHKYSAEEQCEMSKNLQRDLKEQKVPCKGIADAVRAHEVSHQKVCIKVGGSGIYWARHKADVAADEAAAYGAQIAVLKAEIARALVGCPWRATGQDGPVTYSGVICGLQRSFVVTGQHPLFTFPFKFTPSTDAGTAGTMTYQTAGSGIAAQGGGSYRVEGLDASPDGGRPDAGNPGASTNAVNAKIIVDSHSTAKGAGVATQGGGIATINLIPDKNTTECQDKWPH